MFCLQNQIFILAASLATVSTAFAQPDVALLNAALTDITPVNITQVNMTQADVVPDRKSDAHLLLQSRIPGHADTVWKYFGDLHANELAFEVISMPLSGAYEKSEADVVEMLLHDAMAACEEGDINLLPLDQILPVEIDLDDYVWNGLQPCSIGHSVWADIITYDNTMYLDKAAPESMRDFFNLNAFPGKRVLKKTPRALAEWSQLLEGVSYNNLYQSLSSESGWHVLEAALQLLESELIWVENDRQALEILDNGNATFALVASQNLARRISDREVSDLPHTHYRVIWDAAIAHMSMLTVPKQQVRAMPQEKVSSAEKTLEFLRYVAEPIRNVQLSTAFGYAPANKSRADFIQKKYQLALPVDLQLDSLVWSNDKWWRESGAGIEKKFQTFLENTSWSISTAKN